jgi:hypothetical protein
MMRNKQSLLLLVIAGFLKVAGAWEVDGIEGGAFISYPSAEENLERIRVGQTLESGVVLVTGENARVTLKNGSMGSVVLARLSALQIKENQRLYLARGSGLWDLRHAESSMELEGKLAAVSVSRGTFLLEATAVGGLKIINLGKRMKVRAGGAPTVPLRAGELVFARTGDEPFSRVIPIYLKELLSTSKLVDVYSEDDNWRSSVDAYAQLQYENLTGLSEAFVGDAVTDGDVELYVKE